MTGTDRSGDLMGAQPRAHMRGAMLSPLADESQGLFNGLRVRMGIATGKLEKGQVRRG